MDIIYAFISPKILITLTFTSFVRLFLYFNSVWSEFIVQWCHLLTVFIGIGFFMCFGISFCRLNPKAGFSLSTSLSPLLCLFTPAVYGLASVWPSRVSRTRSDRDAMAQKHGQHTGDPSLSQQVIWGCVWSQGSLRLSPSPWVSSLIETKDSGCDQQ